ncbi:MAG: hypothetical protein WEE36_08695 [Acidimicrobiia bacterium]
MGDNPDVLTTAGLDRLLARVPETSLRRLLPQVISSNDGYLSGVAQIAVAAVVRDATGSAVVIEDPTCSDHPADVTSTSGQRRVECEVKYWSVTRELRDDGSWEAPVMAPGVEAAAAEVFGSSPGNASRPPGRGRVAVFRDHFEEARHQLVRNDPDHEALRVAAVVTRLCFPGEYFCDVMRGESTVAFSIRPDGEIDSSVLRPYDQPGSGFEPTGLANRSFRDEVDIALWFCYQPALGVTDHRIVSSEQAGTLAQAIASALKGN